MAVIKTDRIRITKQMVDCTSAAILKNTTSDQDIAADCLGDPRHHRTVSDMRRSMGYRKDLGTGKLLSSQSRGKRTWENSTMPRYK